jgi:hypothetical protein
LFVEKRNPVCTAICRLPDSTRDRSKVVRVRFAYDTLDCERATAAKRTNLSPTHPIEQLFIDCSGRCWSRRWSGSKRSWKKENRNSERDSNQVNGTAIRPNHPPKVKSLRLGSTGIAPTRGEAAKLLL